jgi:hypothetical protein
MGINHRTAAQMKLKAMKPGPPMKYPLVAVIALAMIGLASATPAASAQITRDGDAVYLNGIIEAADYLTFLGVVGTTDDVTVYLSSPGGEVYPAMAIGRFIRVRGFGTMVPAGGECASACVLIWAAGYPRSLDPYARLGLHCSRLVNRTICYGPGRVQMQTYLREMGMPPSVAAIPIMGDLPITWIDHATKGLIVRRAPPWIAPSRPNCSANC